MAFKWWLFITILLFGTGLVLGLTTPGGIGFVSEQITALEKFANLLSPLPRLSIFVFIFIKNASAVLVSFILSPIFCLVPVLALISNGWLIGLITDRVIQEKSLGYLLAGLLPHGIFELPALIIGEAVALSFGTAVLLALVKGRKGEILTNLRKNLKYLVLSLVLFLPAAIIEAYLTPLLLR